MSSSISRNTNSRFTPPWRADGLRYQALSWYLRNRFGGPVRKISLDAGLSCPNAFGDRSSGGCVFCNIRSFSPSRRAGIGPIDEQLLAAIERFDRSRRKPVGFLAYFQPGTNTFAPVDKLAAMIEQALGHPRVLGVILGTRPDCVPEPVLDMLAEFARRTWVLIEYGLQSIHDRSLAWLNRGHDYAAFVDAVGRTRRRGIDVGAHLILGIPGESRDDMLATAAALGRLDLHSVKLHNLYVAKDTRLAELWAQGKAPMIDRDEYVRLVVDFLERLPSRWVIDRLSADAPPEYLIAPAWCLDKATVHRAIERELEARDTWQGRLEST